MQDKNKVYKNIAGSLQYGMIYHKKIYIMLYVCIAICLSLFIFNAVPFILVAFGTESVGVLFEGPIPACAISLFSACVLLIQLLLSYRLKKEIYSWLDDVVELTAQSMMYSSIRGAKKLMVRFEYGGKKYTFLSGKPKKSKNSTLRANQTLPQTSGGYAVFFNLYADRTIKILFSKKYSQVLILKDKTAKYN